MSNGELYKKLGSCSTIRSGQTFKMPLEEYSKGELTVLIPKDIMNGEPNPEAIKIDSQMVPSLQNHLLQTGEILIANKGTKFNTLLYDGIPFPLIATTAFYIISPNKDLMPEYLNWYLNQKEVKEYFASNAKGSVIPNITKSILNELPVPLIPLHEQHDIYAFIKATRSEQLLLKELLMKKEEFSESYIWERIKKYS